MEALEYEQELEKIFILNTMKGHFEKQVRHYARLQGVPVAKVPPEKLNRLVKSKAHQGVVAIMAPVKYQDLSTLLDKVKDQKVCKFVLLDGVQDVRNIGAIARSVKVFGMDALILSAKNCGQINEDTVKASAGAILNIHVSRVPSTLSGIEVFKDYGFSVVASDLQSKNKLDDFTFPDKAVLVIGSEDKGVDRNVLAVVDKDVVIQQQSQFDSLNVSVATGILLYQWSK
jgi:23S rRNA (guanosine2251-2'-O)-methyltransferase